MLIQLKAKVRLVSEEQMEIEDKYDLGNIAKDKEWEWKNIGISVESIYKIIEFNKNKTVVELVDDEKILVAEPFEQVFQKWKDVLGEMSVNPNEENGE